MRYASGAGLKVQGSAEELRRRRSKNVSEVVLCVSVLLCALLALQQYAYSRSCQDMLRHGL